MYAAHTDGTPGLHEKLMGVDLPPVDKPNGSRDARLGVEIRNALAFKLYGAAIGMPPTHKLVITLHHPRSSLILDPATALPSIENYGIDAQYNLIEIVSNKSVMTGSPSRGCPTTSPASCSASPAARLPRRRRPRLRGDRGKYPAQAGVVFHGGS